MYCCSSFGNWCIYCCACLNVALYWCPFFCPSGPLFVCHHLPVCQHLPVAFEFTYHKLYEISCSYMRLFTRKPVSWVFDQVRLKSARSATEGSESHEIATIETRDIILSRQRTTKAQISLRICADDLRLCCSHMAKTGFIMTWLKLLL